MSLSQESEEVVRQWLSDLKSHTSENFLDDPNYYLYNPQSLFTSSVPQSFILGTGGQVSANILKTFSSVQHEILFVTCFWAESASQMAFASALKALSLRALSEHRRIRVRICFSSSSLWQKLTQTSSLSGKDYAPSTWARKFGLPNPSELQGLDIIIRSIFVLPFSVMHSKFVIIDREKVFMPSCNVSWEDWFEGCIELRGDIVNQTLLFWDNFWGRDEPRPPLKPDSLFNVESGGSHAHALPNLEMGVVESGTTIPKPFFHSSLSHLGTVPTILLPSPHHRNPSFRPFPFSVPSPPPPTPLNIFLLKAFNNATENIYIQSPNITSPPVLSAIRSAIKRGVNVKIISNTKMMVAEQLVTAGRITEWALRDLHRSCSKSQQQVQRNIDLEAALCEQGTLETFYYQFPESRRRQNRTVVPVKSHLKLTIIDEEIVVLGSGNMDRASWYTSQELGVAFFSRELVREIMSGVVEGLEGCLVDTTA